MTDADLRQHLQAALARPIARLTRRACEYCASFTIEELDVTFDDRTTLELIYKELSRASMLETAKAVKPDFLLDPRREIEVYRSILTPAGIETARFYAAVEQPGNNLSGIFLGRVPGRHLWQEGNFAAWEAAARWLAHLHHSSAADVAANCTHLLRYDRTFHQTWIDRARRFVCENPSRPPTDCQFIHQLARIYDNVVERLASIPVTFIHGDYHASNVLCAASATSWRIWPIDWEMAGLGPAAIDLAALTAGNWSEQERQQMIRAYWNALPANARAAQPFDDLRISVEYSRLHWAIRWLGWSDHWSPPRTQAQDWMAVAISAARRLELDIDIPDPSPALP
jgi:hypothetical protein